MEFCFCFFKYLGTACHQVPAAWREELDDESLGRRVREFQQEAGEYQFQYPGIGTDTAYRTDFGPQTSPEAYRRYGPLRLWRVGGVRSFNRTFEYCPHLTGTGLEAWDVRSGRDFRCMFYGCVALRVDLSGWRLGGGAGEGIKLQYMLRYSGAAAVGSLEAWVAERHGPGGAERVDVYGMLERNTGTQEPGWASAAKHGDSIHG